MTTETLLHRIGGESVVQRASDLLFAQIMLDDRVNDLFTGLDIRCMVDRQHRFLVQALGGWHHAHADLLAIHKTVVARGFTHEHFDVLLVLLETAFQELGVEQLLIDEVIWRVDLTRGALLPKDSPTDQNNRKQQEHIMNKRVLAFLYAVMCYAAGMAALAYLAGFIGNFVTPTRLDAKAEGPLAYALGLNLGLLLLFAVQHSLMARPSFKKVWTKLVPESVERSTYILFSALALLPLFIFWQPIGFVVWELTNPSAVAAAYSAFAIGWLIVVFSTFLLNHFDLFGLRQAWLNLKGQPYTHLPFATPLLYGMVRHPLYLGWLIVMWATPTMTAAHLFFAVVLTVYIFVAIRLEERNLREYHPEYREYSERVPMILPTGTKQQKLPEPNQTTA